MNTVIMSGHYQGQGQDSLWPTQRIPGTAVGVSTLSPVTVSNALLIHAVSTRISFAIPCLSCSHLFIAPKSLVYRIGHRNTSHTVRMVSLCAYDRGEINHKFNGYPSKMTKPFAVLI